MTDKVDLGIQPALADQVGRDLAWMRVKSCGACGSSNLRHIDWAPPHVLRCSNCQCVQSGGAQRMET